MPPDASTVVVRPAVRLRGTLRVPGDKSVSHRYALLAALADGVSRISGYAPGADCAATLNCLEALGVAVRRTVETVEISGRGPRGLLQPEGPLDARNSGTSMRMLSGVLSAHRMEATITGDASLSRRPMRRVIEPLTLMGAQISAAEGDRPPLRIGPPARGVLSGIDYRLPVASAQVKSAILLAGLQAEGLTVVREPVATRDHTERALRAFGVNLDVERGQIAIAGDQRPQGRELEVPGDSSSAAFFGVAAAAIAGSEVTITHVGMNPSRTAWLDVLERAGARIERHEDTESAGEPSGRITVRHGGLGAVRIDPAEVPGLIDELPALGALATHGGEVRVTGASELRGKESDRITAFVTGLRALGADAEELPDGFIVRGSRQLAGGTADAASDHRLAMAFAVAALGAREPSTITGADAVAVSYPGFFETLEALCA
ncbi:MAG: 3-phosphoshikimate 1-carboxyvinyltransferase [Acidobacteriota bacterium]